MVVDGLVSGHFVISQVFGEVGRNLHLLYYITGGVDATIAKHYFVTCSRWRRISLQSRDFWRYVKQFFLTGPAAFSVK